MRNKRNVLSCLIIMLAVIIYFTVQAKQKNGDHRAIYAGEWKLNKSKSEPVGQFAQSTGTFTDSRDGQTYKTISFKNALTGTTVTWMAQNLNYKVEGSYAYDDNENNRKELGLLYTWDAAKKACPSGWHLPTDSEWSLLVSQFGGTDKAGEALKSVKGWNEDGNGTNSSGFGALPGGHRKSDGSYLTLGVLGLFWSSSPTDEVGKAWEWNFHYGGPPSSNKQNLLKAFRFDADVSGGLSVRLVRD